jgi:hypothetical protein
MPTLTPVVLKRALQSKGYDWSSSEPNIIGIRSSLQAPDVFNDILCVVWTQPEMPSGLDVQAQQEWLNSWFFMGANNKPLVADGTAGNNTAFALQEYAATVGKPRIKSWSITTTPGVFYQKNPLSKLGAAVMVPGHYKKAYRLGLHQSKTSHPALVQSGAPVKVYRDNDKNGIADETKVIEEGYFGINIHRSNPTGATLSIGKWSAGCQVFQRMADLKELLELCEHFKTQTGNRYSYTLLREKELV